MGCIHCRRGSTRLDSKMNNWSQEAFVAGNGPSLAEVDFSWLRSMDWLGMNAAYRYWDEIGIYPKFYCCLDKVVIKSHAEEIARLVQGGYVERAFLVKDILEERPELECDPRVDFLEDLVRGNTPAHEIFKTHHANKKTTGSWATRYLMFMGYRRLYLCGIDCNYVEVVEGARETGNDIELVMESDQNKNPNYFFSGYQKEGDRYQLPNPERHFGTLHLQSLEAVKADISLLGWDVEIYNCAKDSQLRRFGVFPFMSVQCALNRSHIDAVVVPLTRRECGTFVENLSLWDLPAFHPLGYRSELAGQVVLHLFFDCEEDAELTQTVTEAIEKSRFVQWHFKELRITYLGLPGSVNYYVKDHAEVGRPRKLGPNVQFLSVMRECANYGHVFLMETDVTPVSADWLSRLSEFCGNAGEFWIAGAEVGGTLGGDPANLLHLNGNAIYHTGSQEFQQFLAEVLEPALLHMTYGRSDSHIAYDCVISRLCAYGMASRERRDLGVDQDMSLLWYFEKLSLCLKYFIRCPEVCTVRPGGLAGSGSQSIEMIDNPMGPAVVHSADLNRQCRDLQSNGRTVNDERLAKLHRQYFQGCHIKPANERIFPYHYFNEIDGLEVEDADFASERLTVVDKEIDTDQVRSVKVGVGIVFGVNGPKIGDRVEARIQLLSDSDASFSIRLERHGGGKFVRDSDTVSLKAGALCTVKLSIEFNDSYRELRICLTPTTRFGRLDCEFAMGDVGGHCRVASPAPSVVVGPTSGTRTTVRRFLSAKEVSKERNEAAGGRPGYRSACLDTPESGRQDPGIVDCTLRDVIALLDQGATRAECLDVLSQRVGERPFFLTALLDSVLASDRYVHLAPQVADLVDEVESTDRLPTVVYIDPVPRKTVSATQELRKKLLRRYPGHKIWLISPDGRNSGRWELAGSSEVKTEALEVILREIDNWRNIRLLVRTGFKEDCARLVYDQLADMNVPLFPMVMDTWDVRLARRGTREADGIIKSFKRVLAASRGVIAITHEMAEHIRKQYGVEPAAIAHNFISHDDLMPDSGGVPIPAAERHLAVLYAGGLEEDMTLKGMFRFIDTVSSFNISEQIALHVKTFMRHKSQAERVEKMCLDRGVRCRVRAADMELDEYYDALTYADMYLITYGDDQKTRDYVRCSFPNKLIDLLIKGKPVVYFGPNFAISRIIRDLNIDGLFAVESDAELARVLRDIAERYSELTETIRSNREAVYRRFGESTVLGQFYQDVIFAEGQSMQKRMPRVVQNA